MPTAEIVTRAIDTATDDVFKCQTLDGPMKESIVAMLHNARKLQNGDAASQEANGRATGQIALTLARHILYHERRETEFDGRVEKAVIKALGSVAVGSGGLHVRQVADNRWRVLAILIVCATIAGTIIAISLIGHGHGGAVAESLGKAVDKIPANNEQRSAK